MAKKLGRVSISGGKTRTQVECDCGAKITCENNTNTCQNCGEMYNMSGQKLAPKEQWGEETGEKPEEVEKGMDDDNALDDILD